MKTEIKKIRIKVGGMTCANCATGIKKHLEKKGLQNVNVNFSTGEASCNHDCTQNKEDIENTIKQLGYTIKTPVNEKENSYYWRRNCRIDFSEIN